MVIDGEDFESAAVDAFPELASTGPSMVIDGEWYQRC